MDLPETGTDPHKWTSRQVAAYLRSVNLAEQYVKVFQDEDINGMVLMTLTREELKGDPFNMKGFAPVKTVLGCISSLKEQIGSGAGLKESVPAPEREANRNPPFREAPPPADFAPLPGIFGPPFGVPPVWTEPRAPPIGLTFPMMPPPPHFPKGFNPDIASRPGIFPIEEEHWQPQIQPVAQFVQPHIDPVQPDLDLAPATRDTPLLITDKSTEQTPLGHDVIGELALDMSQDVEVTPSRQVLPISEFNIIPRSAAQGDQKMKTMIPRVEPIGEGSSNPRYVEVSRGTDLTDPPPNWLNDDSRIHHHYNPGKVEHFSKEFPASALSLAVASDMARGETSGIDIIAPSENLKQLFSVPYSNQELSLSIHRVGQSLVIESGKQDDVNATDSDLMMSKLLYYSILAEDQEIEARKESTSPPPKQNAERDSPPPLEESPEKEGDCFSPPNALAKGEPASETTYPPPSFYRNLKWHFQDLKILLGSDQVVMQHDKGHEIALKLRDVDQPLEPSDALEYWLDNVMNNVPQVAICYHKQGVTQGYQLISTNDIPTFRKEASFEPQLVQEYAGNVLHWLKENCTREAGSYVLVREEDATLKLYDLSAVYEELDKEDNQGALVAAKEKQKKPFAYPVAMLCLRMGGKLADSQNPIHAVKAIELLTEAIDLLPDDTEAVILAEAHGHMATAHIMNSGISTRVAAKEKELSEAKTGKKKGKAEAGSDSTVMVSPVAEQDGFLLAIGELGQAIEVLVKNDPGTEVERFYRERLIHCKLGLAVRYAALDNIAECLRWVKEAEDEIIRAKLHVYTGSRLALTAPPGPAPTGVEIKAEARDPTYVMLAHARLSETVGDVYQAVVRRLLSNVGTTETPTITREEETLRDILKNSPSTSILHQMKGISDDIDTNANRALEFYYTALKQVAILSEHKKDASFGVEVVYPSQSDLKMKLGMVYNLCASNLIRTNRLSKASAQYQQAYLCFDAVKDPNAEINRATTVMNHGKLMQRLANEDAAKHKEEKLSSQEEAFINKAISFFQDAVNTLCPKKGRDNLPPVAAKLHKDAMLLSANAQVQLAYRTKLNFEVLTKEQPDTDFEKRVADLLHSALKTYTTLKSEESEAEAHAQLGQLFMKTLRSNYAPPQPDKVSHEQRQEKRFKYADMYYSKAIDYYAHQKDSCMYIRLRREVCLLHLFQLTVPGVKKEQYLKTVVRTLTKIQPWLTSSKQKIEDGNVEFTQELKRVLELITDVLKEAVKIYSSHTAAPLKRAVSKQSAARLNPLEDAKELYSTALRASDEVTYSTVNGLIDSVAKLFLRE